MLPDNRFGLESSARRRLTAARKRAGRFTPPDWPVSRGPTPNPRRSD
ncbi:hypothetical protein [Paractinoplanes maris]|nr:hypothetical protein [Actinoplanes maris]